jgi:hypothetical protein
MEVPWGIEAGLEGKSVTAESAKITERTQGNLSEPGVLGVNSREKV